MPRKPPQQRYREKSHAQALYENGDLRERVAELEEFVRRVSQLQPGDAGSALKYEALDLLQKSDRN